MNNKCRIQRSISSISLLSLKFVIKSQTQSWITISVLRINLKRKSWFHNKIPTSEENLTFKIKSCFQSKISIWMFFPFEKFDLLTFTLIDCGNIYINSQLLQKLFSFFWKSTASSLWFFKPAKKSSTKHIELRTFRKWVQATNFCTVLNVDQKL